MDVFEQEPVDPNDPILKLENVIVTPHALCWTDECERIMGERAALHPGGRRRQGADERGEPGSGRHAGDASEAAAISGADGAEMRENRVKRALAAGERSLGTMIFEFPTTGIGRIAAAAGAEFVIYDMEHTGWSIETIRGLMASSRAADLVPMVRIPATEYHLIARPLDVGAMGLMVPMVESAEQARTIVDSAKYPPLGRRGARGVAHDDYTGGDIIEKMESANDEVLLIAQIETARGVENVDAIAAVDGIDVLWIGHFDLTNSLGIPGQFSHPTYLEAVERVLEACQRHGKAPGIMAGAVADGQALCSRGSGRWRIPATSGSISWRCGRDSTPCARRPRPESDHAVRPAPPPTRWRGGLSLTHAGVGGS